MFDVRKRISGGSVFRPDGIPRSGAKKFQIILDDYIDLGIHELIPVTWNGTKFWMHPDAGTLFWTTGACRSSSSLRMVKPGSVTQLTRLPMDIRYGGAVPAKTEENDNEE